MTILDLLKITEDDKLEGILLSSGEYKEWWADGGLYRHSFPNKYEVWEVAPFI